MQLVSIKSSLEIPAFNASRNKKEKERERRERRERDGHERRELDTRRESRERKERERREREESDRERERYCKEESCRASRDSSALIKLIDHDPRTNLDVEYSIEKRVMADTHQRVHGQTLLQRFNEHENGIPKGSDHGHLPNCE